MTGVVKGQTEDTALVLATVFELIPHRHASALDLIIALDERLCRPLGTCHPCRQPNLCHGLTSSSESFAQLTAMKMTPAMIKMIPKARKALICSPNSN